jgi:2-methylcitrate dehydratase PrpD
MSKTQSLESPSQQLAAFAASLQFQDIPGPVVRRTEELFLDWIASAIAGGNARAVKTIARFCRSQGAPSGPSEVFAERLGNSPYLAAMANAAASHVVEQDDLHNSSVLHPATVVFPPALAVAQAIGASGRDLITASVAGYEVGVRVGEFLGRSHYTVFHTTGTVGTIAAAAAVGRLLQLNARQMGHAFGSAGTQAAGLWEFLRDAADSKQLHTAHASGAGLAAAMMAKDGLTGAVQIFEGKQGMAAGMSKDANIAALTDRLGARWATAETSFKYHASCRHTHPAADALLMVMGQHQLKMADIAQVMTHVHQGAIDVLGPVTDPQTVHQSKFSMGTVLGLAARYQFAGLSEFEHHFQDPEIKAFCQKVSMTLDPAVDAAYPKRWIGKVTVKTTDDRTFHGQLDEPKGDPGNTLSRTELAEKAQRLAAYSQSVSADEMNGLIQRVWGLSTESTVGFFLGEA